jgi:hypothetical protein
MEIEKYYNKITDGIKLLSNSDNFNSMIVKSKTSMGKSYWIDKALSECGKPYIVFTGEFSEAKFFSFVNDNKDKIIVIRDSSSLLRKLSFIDFLKSATELTKVRKISRMNYSTHEGVPETIEFEGKIIFEINNLPTNHKDDFDAIIERSIFIELNFGKDDIIDILCQISQNPEEKEVTDYIISIRDKIGSELNLRMQKKGFDIYDVCKKDKLNWKDFINRFMFSELPESKKLLYRFAGNNQTRRIEFVKYLMRIKNYSYCTAERRIKNWLYLEEIYSNKLKQGQLSLNPFESPVTKVIEIDKK